MDYANAFDYLIETLRGLLPNSELNLWRVVDAYLYKYEQAAVQSGRLDVRKQQISPILLEAAWELALLGVLRPAGAERIPDAGAEFDGTKYLLTDYGARWVNEGDEQAFVPIGTETFVALLEAFTEFGPEFIERGREAARCWRSKAFLATSVMCGAAAEAILLALAIARTGKREEILETYASKSGRRKIETLVTGPLRTELKTTVAPLFTLVKYWRDQASHGAAANIKQSEARTALQTLYLYAKLVHSNWSEIIQP